ncbi:MAG: menaquinone biosynthesis decarboxylase [Acidobacteriaceae bacterium]|nr:menaquinone biosynthesis decarboxylase [Acidobacteriaceae bacterium]
MAYSDLREFIAALEKAGELKRIPFEVDPYLEITEFADRAVKGGGPALLFEKPKGYSVPLLINSLASERRMQIALQVEEFQQIADRISEYLQMQMPQGLLGKLSMLPKLAEMGSFFPKTVSSAPCQEVVLKGDQIDLGRLPVLTCWPQDGGPYITLPMVFTKNPETGKRNCGMYRMQVYDARTTGMHWQAHKQGAEHYRRRFKAGETKMDVAVAIGADPAVMYAAILPLPPDLDEMMIAGFLRKKPVEMVQCLTVDVDVPANAEYVLEGYVEMGERRTEGPFGDHTGYYSLEDEYPVFHLTCLTHRRNPIYATTIVGPPPMEDYYMGKAIERTFLPLMRMQIPEIRDMCLPAEGIFHNLMLVKIRKSYPMQARKVMHAIWGLGQAMFTKCIVVVDEDVDIQNYSEVAWKALNNIDPQRDIEFVTGPIDSLDHASRMINWGSKMGIDATRKWPEEGFTRRWPDVITMSPEIKRKVDDLWKKAGL